MQHTHFIDHGRLEFEEAWAALPANVQRMLQHLRRECNDGRIRLPVTHRQSS